MIEFKLIIFTALIFVFTVAIHIVYCRTQKPKRHIEDLVLLFILIPIIISIALLLSGCIGFQICLLATLLYLALSGVYIQTYPAIQANSPSLYILYLIGNSEKGLTKSDIETKLDVKQLIGNKVTELEDEELIVVKNKTDVSLTFKGKVLALIFVVYRGVLGLKEGRG